ncbi:predicted protein [Uncinocarpus reesii 1704]|uniref:Azaphilone pigments biosynthesis cluster protein L N-terminal domain-containing protein n=1 Tax=Uncinocarpus reesii (strain UAMH 1704) TaxID=336963 RepID=C4K0B3_UNCRE|nr:uncharacterized protein UREG_07927 [Uncinocarpus reesii 1704]EEP83062.1 predicted protein [Uncinocarpus reesii 1704]
MVGFALKSTSSLYRTVESFRTNKRSIRELKEELESLEQVLISFQQLALETDTDLESLKLPLLRRKATVTTNVLNEYKKLIADTTSDLEEHLAEIESRLQAFPVQRGGESENGSTEWAKIQEERETTRKCIEICTRVGDYIDTVQSHDLRGVPSSSASQRATVETLKECKDKLTALSTEIGKRSEELGNRLEKIMSLEVKLSDEDADNMRKVQAERDGLKQCLAICNEVSAQTQGLRMNVFEDVISADDAHQLIVSTLGDLISAKRITTGARSAQWLGQMSDDALQRLSRDRAHNASDTTVGIDSKTASFQGRYGAGYQLGADGSGMPQNPSGTTD